MRLFENSHLQPLEIWHGKTSFGSLFQVSQDQFRPALFEFLENLHTGSADVLHRNDKDALNSANGFANLCLVGGKARSIFESALKLEQPFKIKYAENLMGLSNFDLTIDWGQTATKIYSKGRLESRPRDPIRFPIRCSVSNPSAPTAESISKIRNYFLELLGDLKPKTIALALPVKIDERLYAEPSTYEGLEGSLTELFSSLTNADIEIMNDAVLAARQVIEQTGTFLDKTLVVTIGYGLGAALWAP